MCLLSPCSRFLDPALDNIFNIMITACLEVFSQTDIYNSSWVLLFSYLWLIVFDLLLLHTCFPLDVGGSGRLHISLNQ